MSSLETESTNMVLSKEITSPVHLRLEVIHKTQPQENIASIASPASSLRTYESGAFKKKDNGLDLQQRHHFSKEGKRTIR